jgi:hypothetical protein
METTPSERPTRVSPVAWAIIVAVVLLNIWYDYHHPRGIILDIIIALIVVVRYLNKSE